MKDYKCLLICLLFMLPCFVSGCDKDEVKEKVKEIIVSANEDATVSETVRGESSSLVSSENSDGSGGQLAPSGGSSVSDITPAPDFSGGNTSSTSPFSLSSVKWLHTNVSKWKETATLSVNVSGSMVKLNYDKADSWPPKKAVGIMLVANPWIFVEKDGQWYGATWEWLRPGQRGKSKSAVAGDHIKKSPLNDFSPVSGRKYGFMVSGLARDSTRNVEERSNIVFVTWP